MSFSFESIADMTELLLSVYELSALSEDIYFDVNQKITSIFSRISNDFIIQSKIAHQLIGTFLETAMKP